MDWRAYPDDFVAQGSDLFVRKATVEYFSAAYYDDELEICGRIARLGNSSMRFVAEMYRRRQYEAVLVTAELIYVHTELASRTAQLIRDEMRVRIRAFETTVPEDGTDASRAG